MVENERDLDGEPASRLGEESSGQNLGRRAFARQLAMCLGLFAVAPLVSSCSSSSPDEEPVEEVVPEVMTKKFKVTVSNWKFEPANIHVNKGDMVELHITNTEGVHIFYLPDYDIRVDLASKGRTVVKFEADKIGTFAFNCDFICGPGHNAMKGTLVVSEV